MNCDQIEELISDLIDGELSEQVRTGVEQHIASCERCAALHKQMQRTVRFVRANASPTLAADTAGGWYADFVRSLMDTEFVEGNMKRWADMAAQQARASQARENKGASS